MCCHCLLGLRYSWTSTHQRVQTGPPLTEQITNKWSCTWSNQSGHPWPLPTHAPALVEVRHKPNPIKFCSIINICWSVFQSVLFALTYACTASLCHQIRSLQLWQTPPAALPLVVSAGCSNVFMVRWTDESALCETASTSRGSKVFELTALRASQLAHTHTLSHTFTHNAAHIHQHHHHLLFHHHHYRHGNVCVHIF